MIQVTALALAILSQPAPVPMVYGIMECSEWPLTQGQLASDGIRVVSVHQAPGRRWARLEHPASGRRANFVAFRLGSREAGWSVWSVRAPSTIRSMLASSPVCRVALTYDQVRALPAAQRDWIAARSTCYGAATWRGRSYSVWPCSWSTERAGEGSVTNWAAVGPGVLAGGSGAEAAGVEE